MLLKNLILYRLPADWRGDADDLEQKLAAQPLMRCGSFDLESRGWVPPEGEGAPYLYRQNRHWLMTLGMEEKLLPASVIRQMADERVAAIAKNQPFPVGRKQKRDIKEQVTEELLPRALSRRRETRAWVDAEQRLLAIDASADSKCETFLETLRRADDGIAAIRLDTQTSASTAMTKWLMDHDVPGRFTIDDDLELRTPDAARATVRYVRHGLEGKDIRDHITAGKTPVRLGLTWNDRISFVLTEHLHVKRIAFANLLGSDPGGEGGNEDDGADEGERFDAEFALLTGELSMMITELVQVLGGEKSAVS